MNQKKWTSIARGLPWDVMALVESPAPTLPPPVPLPKDVPVPEEWILVKVAYAALNPGAIFQSTLLPMWARQAEAVPEMDLSGTVVDVWHPDSCSGSNGKEGKTRFKKGDKIAAMLPASHTVATGTGALAQYVRIPAQYAVLKPPNATLADAAGVMLAGLTARQLVVDSGAKTGDRVLINAASGGIGHLVVQMVRNVVGSTGYVVGICGGAKASMVKSLGAEEVRSTTDERLTF
jgi:NADPH:quinone reductase-like Zn-dependent oxidoreductase